MSACPTGQVKVLILGEEISAPRPLEVVGLYDLEIDTDQFAAMHAAHVVKLISLRFITWLETLDQATGLLAESAKTSTRATAAYDRFRSALGQCQLIVAALSDAQDALEFNWKKAK